ncbi:DNA glycosylase [Roridomyces roridus]|uniref:Endonuclease III homolog n=1 Tax=Roridomyces roridus TaxID=1738132 RepID=A0AAD7FCE2_9AGAR|nr:DNA glycosylase [Roridomyces roridus]
MPALRATPSRLRANPPHLSVTIFELEDQAPDVGLKKRAQDDVDEGDKTKASDASPSPSKRPRSSAKSSTNAKSKTTHKKALAKPHPAPPQWRQVYDTIKEMRSKIVAPVDTMGCHMAQKGETDPKNKRFVTLVSLMLSPQTKDQVTDAAVGKLRTALGGSVSLDAVLTADRTVIEQAVNKVGMWATKAKHIKATAEKLRDEFDSDVPQTIEGLLSLPGVGPKIGFLVLQNAWNANVGIGVDVHVLRITRLLGWHKAKTPEDARISLESWLPKELHAEINPLLVGFGQTICPSNKPRCGECALGSGLCPSSTVKSRQPIPDW